MYFLLRSLLLFFLLSPLAAKGQFYASPSLGFLATTADEQTYNGLAGMGYGATFGYKLINLLPEAFIKFQKYKGKNETAAGEAEVEIENLMMGVGIRVHVMVMSLQIGFLRHTIESSAFIIDTGANILNGPNGTYNGIYIGIGGNFPIGGVADFYFDGIVQTTSRESYLVFFELGTGVRFYF